MRGRRLQIVLSGWHRASYLTAAAVVIGLTIAPPLQAQDVGRPSATTTPAPADVFPNDTDSNSPAVWELADGRWSLTLFNSVAGRPRVSQGPSLRRLVSRGDVDYVGTPPEQGVWFESVIRDAEAWYAFYHNERANVVCPDSGKAWPRIGAARSEDGGATWVDLGPIFETPATSVRCDSANHYFVGGGAGDLNVRLDPDRQYAYLYFSQYAESEGRVGVAVARLAWADRDAPAGRVDVWVDGAWIPPRQAAADDEIPGAPASEHWVYPVGTPIFPSTNSWDDDREGVDVLWGPSIHWNTAIRSWVMLLNQATGDAFEQGGVWIAFSDRLDDPRGWSAPVLLLKGGPWYPQVVGLDPTVGTDALAGGVARFYVGGRSDHFITFSRR